jgi:hypothetical protein
MKARGASSGPVDKEQLFAFAAPLQIEIHAVSPAILVEKVTWAL